MDALTEAGRRAVADLSARYGVSADAVETLARAVARGGGTMAQFDVPELGGSGQWMAGGMTMVGDMFNSGLQSTVSGLCGELSAFMAAEPLFKAPPSIGAAAPWWPAELGAPSSVGGQNTLRYAYFPDARRLAIDFGDGSPIRLLDTGAHQIGGFSQQQSGVGGDPLSGLTFSSQLGQYAVASLPHAGAATSPQSEPFSGPHSVGAPSESDAPAAPEPGPKQAQPQAFEAPPAEPTATTTDAPADLDPIDAIRRLGELKDAGLLSEAEFAAKKAELLGRI